MQVLIPKVETVVLASRWNVFPRDRLRDVRCILLLCFSLLLVGFLDPGGAR